MRELRTLTDAELDMVSGGDIYVGNGGQGGNAGTVSVNVNRFGHAGVDIDVHASGNTGGNANGGNGNRVVIVRKSLLW